MKLGKIVGLVLLFSSIAFAGDHTTGGGGGAETPNPYLPPAGVAPAYVPPSGNSTAGAAGGSAAVGVIRTPSKRLLSNSLKNVVWLKDHLHTVDDCKVAGGQTYNLDTAAINGDCSAGNCICKFSFDGCGGLPQGKIPFQKYLNYVQTAAKSCSGTATGSCTGNTSCSVPAQAFGNAAPATCSYKRVYPASSAPTSVPFSPMSMSSSSIVDKVKKLLRKFKRTELISEAIALPNPTCNCKSFKNADMNFAGWYRNSDYSHCCANYGHRTSGLTGNVCWGVYTGGACPASGSCTVAESAATGNYSGGVPANGICPGGCTAVGGTWDMMCSSPNRLSQADCVAGNPAGYSAGNTGGSSMEYMNETVIIGGTPVDWYTAYDNSQLSQWCSIYLNSQNLQACYPVDSCINAVSTPSPTVTVSVTPTATPTACFTPNLTCKGQILATGCK